jgi:hypothetical protein
MQGKIGAVLDKIEARREAIPENIDTWDLVRGIARGKYVVSSQQMKALEMELDRLRPKVSAVAVGHFDTDGFASMLDRAIERRQPKLIELQPEPVNSNADVVHSASELKGNFAKLRRV